MRLSLDLSNISVFNTPKDVVSSISTSLQTRQIERLRPPSLNPRSQKLNSMTRPASGLKPKIASELRGAVEILKSRLTEKIRVKRLAEPCSRLKFVASESDSCGYHQKSSSISGFEFPKSPRMQDSTVHKLNCFNTFSSTSPKKQEKKEFELKNIQTVQNISQFLTGIKEKNARHNWKVARNAQEIKILKFQQREKRKSDFLLKEQRAKWKETHVFEIKKAKTKWLALMVTLTAAVFSLNKIKVRKFEKLKTQRMIRRFFAFTCFLGKFLMLLKRKRKFLLYKNVRLFLQPLTEHIEREKKVFTRNISKFMWKVVNSQHFSRLLIVWRKHVVFLQLAVKDFLAIRDARILALSRIHNKTNNNQAIHRRVTLVPGLLNEADVVQPSRKRNIIEYIKWYLNRFLSTKSSFQLLSDHKSQKEFFQRPSIVSTRKRSTTNNK